MKLKNEIISDVRDSVIEFESGYTLKIEDDHIQDCCESVYADMSTMDMYKEQLGGKNVNRVEVVGVDDEGFLLKLYNDEVLVCAIFVGCYNEQNGYYSSNLSLKLEYMDFKEIIDISNFTKDRID